MNCEQYRQAIAADPAFDGGAGHLAECGSCQAYRREMLELDRMIGRALAIDVPRLDVPELPDISADKVVTLESRRGRAPVWLAIAATVVLAAFVGIRMGGDSADDVSLADELLAHIDHDPAALAVTDVVVSESWLDTVVPASIGHFDAGADLITYAQSCRIRGRDVPHLVIQGEHGPVTVILLPHVAIDGAETVVGDSVNGIILPVGDGSIAIFGERDEALEALEKKVLDSIAWRT